eukprot:SAG11_NODE_6560_length_1288_cov_2.417998_3_plen_158_part_00
MCFLLPACPPGMVPCLLRRAQGFRRRRNFRPRRAPDPLEQSEFKQLLINYEVEAHQFIFIDEGVHRMHTPIAHTLMRTLCFAVHRATRDFYRQYGYYRVGCPAFTPIDGNISDAFSTLAAMTVEGLISWDTVTLVCSGATTTSGDETLLDAADTELF